MKRPGHALVLLKPQFLGDAVMACPLIDSAAAAFERATVSCGPLVQEALRDRSDRVRFMTGSKISGLAPVLRTARQLRLERFDVAFVVNRSFRSALAVRLAGIPIRIGHATEGRGLLLTHRVSYEPDRAETECQLDLIRTLGLLAADPRPWLKVDDSEIGALAEELSPIQIGVQPGARYPEKQVPLEVLAQVVTHMQKGGFRVGLFGGSDEAPFVPEFMSKLSEPTPDFVGRLALRESMAAMKGLRFMLGSDTGLMHLAAAVGCPTMTVFGPNPAQKWAHNYPPHQHIAAPNGQIRNVSADSILERIGPLRG